MRTENKNWLAILLLAGGAVLTAQTQVDLRTQSKSVDFSAASETRPVKTGTVLPALCNVGDLFFNTVAVAGSNLYACIAFNTWAVETGGSGGSGGLLTVSADDTTVGARAILNFVTGAGIIDTLLDTGTQINIQHTADTSVMLSKAAAQTGATTLCASASGSSTTYTCSMAPTLDLYTTGMTLEWQPDVTGAGGPTTLNIDTLGAVSLKLADGATDPTALDLIGGRMNSIWYDGTVFRLAVAPPMLPAGSVTQPACAVAIRGRLWFTVGATGVKDGLSVCAKDATNAYAWRVLY
jgi:hypothetical protein